MAGGLSPAATVSTRVRVVVTLKGAELCCEPQSLALGATEFRVDTVPLLRPMKVRAVLLEGGQEVAASPEFDIVAPVGAYDWGRVRSYFSLGAFLTTFEPNSSKSNPYIGFNMDANWLQGEFRRGGGWLANAFLDARLTPIPIEPNSQPSLGQLLQTHQAVLVQGGVYLPLFLEDTTWQFRGDRHALFFGPLLKAGLQSVGDDPRAGLYGLYGAGVRFGHYRFLNTFEPKNVAPELISYMDIAVGKWENFERFNAQGRRILPWRTHVEARLKIPGAPLPFQTGFDANLGAGRDDLRFLFSVHFDIGKAMGYLVRQ